MAVFLATAATLNCYFKLFFFVIKRRRYLFAVSCAFI